MRFNDDKTPLFMIEDQNDTIRDISEIVERYYDMGTVVKIKKLDIGNTNFNYFITLTVWRRSISLSYSAHRRH